MSNVTACPCDPKCVSSDVYVTVLALSCRDSACKIARGRGTVVACSGLLELRGDVAMPCTWCLGVLRVVPADSRSRMGWLLLLLRIGFYARTRTCVHGP
jgi:hypothetical protein